MFIGGHEVHLIMKSGMCVLFPAPKSKLTVDANLVPKFVYYCPYSILVFSRYGCWVAKNYP